MAHGAMASDQDTFTGKHASTLACTMPLNYKCENLLLQIHTSVGVVIMCQRVWAVGRRYGVVIFMAEQELDRGKGTSFKNSNQDSWR